MTLNAQLCEALGLDASQVTRLVITADANVRPLRVDVTVDMVVLENDELVELVKRCQLVDPEDEG